MIQKRKENMSMDSGSTVCRSESPHTHTHTQKKEQKLMNEPYEIEKNNVTRQQQKETTNKMPNSQAIIFYGLGTTFCQSE